MQNQKHTVLIVDDEHVILDILQDYFECKDFVVYRAENGEDALTIAKEVDLDFMLLDLVMPKMDGLTVLKAVKQLKPTMGVVIISGLRDEDLARETISLGAHDYVTKPFDFNQLDLVVMTNLIIRPDAA